MLGIAKPSNLTSPIPACIPSSNITNASLYFWIDAVNCSSSSPSVQVQPWRVTGSWTETGVNYSNEPIGVDDSNGKFTPTCSYSRWALWNVINSINNWQSGILPFMVFI